MSLLLDHVALFCEPLAHRELAELEQAGFCEDSGRKHDGQCRSNRVVLFEPNYLELVWIDEPQVAETNPLRLNERYALANGALFGVGLRHEGKHSDLVADWTPY